MTDPGPIICGREIAGPEHVLAVLLGVAVPTSMADAALVLALGWLWDTSRDVPAHGRGGSYPSRTACLQGPLYQVPEDPLPPGLPSSPGKGRIALGNVSNC